MTSSAERVKALPFWSSEVDPEPLKGGLSNESFTVIDKGQKFVVRFGEDFPVHHVFRDSERMASAAAYEGGFAPELVHATDGVMVFQFIQGRTFDGPDVQANIERVADLTRRFHTEMPGYVSGPGRLFWPFHVVRDYARTLGLGNSRMMDKVPGYLELAAELEAAQVPTPIIYAHNDMLPANFIDDGDKIWLIDFEYAAYSTPMFDLAGIASNAEFDTGQDERLLSAYFGRTPDTALLRSHAAMKCASLLREAMWSMVSEIHLDTPGVDYVAYTEENLERLAGVIDDYRTRF